MAAWRRPLLLLAVLAAAAAAWRPPSEADAPPPRAPRRLRADPSAHRAWCARHAAELAAAPRVVYIDAGANWANTLRLWAEVGCAGDGGGAAEERAAVEVYAFEACPLMAPFVHNVTRWLNGHALSAPEVPIPIGGSTMQTVKLFGRRFGCADAGATNVAKLKCMLRAARANLTKLEAEAHALAPRYNSSAFVRAALAQARGPPPPPRPGGGGGGAAAGWVRPGGAGGVRAGAAPPRRARYTFVPAAVGAADGWVRLRWSALTLLRGGSEAAGGGGGGRARRAPRAQAGAPRRRRRRRLWTRRHRRALLAPPPADGGGAGGAAGGAAAAAAQRRALNGGDGDGGGVYTVRTVDLPGWLLSSFAEPDWVVLKMDIEGAEHELLDALIKRGGARLVDVLAWECHGLGARCAALAARLRRAGVRTVVEENRDYVGFDRAFQRDFGDEPPDSGRAV